MTLSPADFYARQQARIQAQKAERAAASPRTIVNDFGNGRRQVSKTWTDPTGRTHTETSIESDNVQRATRSLWNNITDSQYKVIVLIEMVTVMALASVKNWDAVIASAGIHTSGLTTTGIWLAILTTPAFFVGFLAANILINGLTYLAGIAVFAVAFLAVDAGAGLFAAGLGGIMVLAMLFGPAQWFTPDLSQLTNVGQTPALTNVGQTPKVGA